MDNKIYTLPTFGKNKWFRLSLSFLLAFVFALILLVLPLTARINPHLPFSGQLDLSLPFGAEIVHATGGLTITKTASPTPTVNEGGLLTYTLVVRNDTSFNLTYVTVTDTVPANTRCILMIDPPSGWLFNGSTGCGDDNLAFWQLLSPNTGFGGVITAGTAVTLSYVVQVNQPLPDLTQIANAAGSYGIQADSPSPFADAGAETITTTVFAPTWEISKAVAPSTTAEPLDVLTYTLTITNIGHMATSGFYTITDQVPAGTTYVTDSAFPAAIFNNPVLTWITDTQVSTNTPFTVSFAVTVNDELPDKTELVNQDYNVAGGNVFSPAVGAPVTVTVETPVTLTVTKEDTPDPVQAGDLITYILTITNDSFSKGPASNVVISDTVPANTTFEDAGFINPADGIVSSNGSLVVWDFTDPEPLHRNQTASVFMVVRVTSPLTSGTVITNDTYSVSATNTEVNIVGLPVVTTTVESLPVLEIFKVGFPEPVEAGGQLTYTIRYTNSGNADATNVFIQDTFPLSTSHIADVGTPAVSPGITTTNNIAWNIPFLRGQGGGGIITLTLSVDEPQDLGTVLTNVVSITSSEVITPQFFTTFNTINSSPNLHIQKTADPSPVAVGSVLTYTIAYSNDGNANAVGAAITDVLDSRVSFNDASPGYTFNNGLVSWAGLSIPANGQDQVLTLSVTVPPTLPNDSLLMNDVTVVAANVVATDSITTLVQAPTLVVTKFVSPTGFIRAGDNVEYRIIYTNTGAITITLPGVLITDTLPVSVTNIVSGSTEATFVTALPPEYVWTDTDLPPGGFGVITLTGQVITSPWASSGGQISNSVIIAGSGYSATTTTDIQGRPGLPFTLTVTAVPPTQQVGLNVLTGAQAEDIFGNPVFDGTSITLTTSLSGSTINGSSAPVVINTSGGQVSANLSSTVASTTTLGAQISGASSSIITTTIVTFTPGAVDRFILAATSPQTAGVTFPISITAVDVFGNRVTSANDTVTINDTTGTITPISTTLVNGFRVGNFRVFSATSPALDTITAISGTITGTVDVEIRPNVPTTLTVTAVPTSINVCQTAAVTTTLTDAFGNAIPSKEVNLALIPGATSDFSPNPGNTNSAGIFTSTLTGRTPSNLATIQATTASPLLIDTATIRIITPAIATNLNLTVIPNPLAVGGNTATVTATVLDCFGASPNQVVTFTVSDLTLVSLNPAVRTTNASGVATTTVTSNSTEGVVVITATVGSLVQTRTLILNTQALTITKTANPASGAEVRPNNIINYTLQVRNTGTGTATNVVISDTLPAGVSFVACTPPANCSGGPTTTVTTPALGPNQVFTANIQVSVSAVPSGTILSNQARVLSSQTPLTTSNIVTHSVTTATLDVFLPVIFKDFASRPDLISSFSLSPANPSAGQPVVVTVVITNVGTGSTGNGFWVDFYINPTPAPTTGNQRWDKLGSTVSPKQGIAWAIPSPGLAPGASIILTSNGVGGLAPSGPQTIWNGSFVAGTQDLFVYADSFSQNGSPNGGIVESNESNNRSELHFVAPLSGGELIDLSNLPDPASLPPRWDP
ncbi:MAG: hypothetical protein BroJett011_71240 [Chloroflexota bacterium]|nr:MAG: hypothetical protein BroJett011_71240 [Chloroflexota bacterium]